MAGLAAFNTGSAQTVVTVRGVPLSAMGSIGAADFDGDGDNDLMVIGQKLDRTPVTGLFAFNARLVEPIPRQGPRIVADHTLFPFPSRRMISGDVAWADVDGDGDQDLLITGTAVDDVDITQAVEQPATDIFENDGRTLVIRNTPGIPPLVESVAAWGDMDGDGDQDLALSGRDEAGNRFLGIFAHDGAFGFSPVASDWTTLEATDLAWGDFDGDGDSDLLVSGLGTDGPANILLVNGGSGAFSETDPGLPGRYFSSISAGDFDGDGDDDVVLTGGIIGPGLLSGVSDVYRSENGQFVALDSGIGSVFSGHVDWGDFDGDGDLDILVAGIVDLSSNENQRILVYEQQDGAFTLAFSLRGVLFGPTIWYDSNGNGRLDILMSGIQEKALVMSIFEL
jgi:VCBS repeat protein